MSRIKLVMIMMMRSFGNNVLLVFVITVCVQFYSMQLTLIISL